MADQAKQQQAKVLRIGVVQGGKIVHERLIKPGQAVTIGESPKNTFVVKADGLPKRYTLFQPDGQTYKLGLSEAMSGKVALDGGIRTVGELLASTSAGSDGQRAVPLSLSNRGKVVVGDVTILFQFVAAPPESARQVARHDFRPRLMDDDDPVFLGFLALWSAVGAVMLVYAFNTEPVDTVSLDELPDRFVNIVIPEKPDKAPPPEDAKVDEDAPEVEKTDAQKKEKVEEKDDTPPPKNDKERRENEASRLEKKRKDLSKKSAIIGLLATRGANNNGDSVADVFADGGGTGDLEAVLGEVSTAEVAGDAGPGMKGSAEGDGRGDAGVDVGGTGAGSRKSEVKEVKAAAPKGRASVGSVEAYDGEGADAVKSALRKYNGQLKACYESRLKQNPNISGRVVLEIDVASGKVTSASIAENTTGDSALGSCITSRARRWRLPSEATGLFALPFTFEGA